MVTQDNANNSFWKHQLTFPKNPSFTFPLMQHRSFQISSLLVNHFNKPRLVSGMMQQLQSECYIYNILYMMSGFDPRKLMCLSGMHRYWYLYWGLVPILSLYTLSVLIKYVPIPHHYQYWISIPISGLRALLVLIKYQPIPIPVSGICANIRVVN